MTLREIVVLVLFAAGAQACAGVDFADVAEVLSSGGALDEATVADGLQQALAVGVERASADLSRPGGFGDDPVLRLELPESVEPVVKAARLMGFSAQVDALEIGMNRAAETAAGHAVPVFSNAIAAMTIRDAFQILRGPDDAATRYFQERTSGALHERFEPVVGRSMKEVGLYRTYKELAAAYEALPFSQPVAPQLESYITQRTIAGLFRVLAVEEARIRENPAARTTALLRRVFGSESRQGAE